MILNDVIKKYGLLGLSNLGPNTHNYYVDTQHTNALDADDGEHGFSWDLPFKKIGYAITASNLTAGSYGMNNIFVNAGTYTEDLATAPKNVNIIAVGAKVRIQGNHTFTASQNYHFWNIQFRMTAGILITLTGTTYAPGWHGCTFEGSGSATQALKIGNTQDSIVEDCRFLGNPLFTTAIQFTAAQIRTRVSRNWIAATTNGILIDSYNGDYGNLIDNNFISRQSADPNATPQMDYGIKMMRATGTPKWLIAKNSIEAVDGIYSATADTHFQNICIGNRVNAAGTGGWEDEGA